MNDIRKILADVRPRTGDQPAVERAAQIAKATGASVLLYLCDYLEPLDGGLLFHGETVKSAREAYLRELGEWLEQQARPLREAGIAVEVEVAWDSPRHEAILARSASLPADVIVRAARKHGALDRFLLGATDWELIRRAPQLLWLVKKVTAPGRELQVAAAVDPAHPSDRAAGLDRKLLRTAQGLCGLFGGSLHLFHAWNPRASIAPVATASHHVALPALKTGGDIVEELRKQREARVRELAVEADVPDERLHIVPGDPSHALQAVVAEQGIDVVVAGAVKRGRFERFLIGNTAEEILNDVDCDVVVVKPDGFEGSSRQS